MARVSIFCLVLAMAALAAPETRAQLFQGTPQEQAACRPDAAKFCRAYMPDNFRVLSCLQANRAKLRRACQKVLRDNGQ
jgi:hypothetical protein